ncbi:MULTISPECIES: hypothetical protein [Aurantimonas]|uniref:hypothetical protein n=1 Tax=Aurantimonas TaxID=182269 RepID=UPI003514F4D4
MSQDDTGSTPPKLSRQERLEAQLRENLRKRKEQARARRQSAQASQMDDNPDPAGAGDD